MSAHVACVFMLLISIARQDAPAPAPDQVSPAGVTLLRDGVTFLIAPGAPPDRTDPVAIDARIAELLDASAKELDPLRAGHLKAEAANRILSFRLARPATALLCGVATEKEMDSLRGGAGEAAKLLDEVGAALSARSAAPADEDAQVLAAHTGTLRTLARAMQLCGGAQEDRAEVRPLLSKLAVLLESDDARLTAAASLWYARLAGKREDWMAARNNLPSPVKPPGQDAPPAALFVRLERCRLESLLGNRALALSSLARMEESCGDWFDAGQAAPARRAVQLVRLGVLEDWRAELEHLGKSEEVQWCRGAIERVTREWQDEPDHVILPLTEAAPFMMGN